MQKMHYLKVLTLAALQIKEMKSKVFSQKLT